MNTFLIVSDEYAVLIPGSLCLSCVQLRWWRLEVNTSFLIRLDELCNSTWFNTTNFNWTTFYFWYKKYTLEIGEGFKNENQSSINVFGGSGGSERGQVRGLQSRNFSVFCFHHKAMLAFNGRPSLRDYPV